jgi:hypothetical protein
VRVALGELEDPADINARFDDLGLRLGRLEAFAFGE